MFYSQNVMNCKWYHCTLTAKFIVSKFWMIEEFQPNLLYLREFDWYSYTKTLTCGQLVFGVAI